MRRLGVLLAVLIIAVNTSPALAFETAVERVEAGVIMDVSPAKILYRDPDFTPGGGLHIRDRATGAVEDIPPVPNRYPVRAYLSPHGAIFSGGLNHPNIGIFEWRDGAMIDHGMPSTSTVLRAAGDFAVWSAPGAPGGGSTVIRRDLAAGTTLEIAAGASNADVEAASNGDVVWHSVPNPDVFRWRDGVTEQLTDDAYWNYSALTDGVNVVYTKAVPHPSGFGDQTAALYTSEGQEILLDPFQDVNAPGPRYDVSGGWAGFSRVGGAGEAQVWRRSPAGATSQVGPSGSSVFLNGVGPTGDVWLGSPATFLAKPGAAPWDMGDEQLGITRGLRGVGGFTYMEGGRWFAALGDTIYELSTGYPRPKGATPARWPLVVANEPCTAPNRTHGPPLAFGSCNPPQKSSQHLTVGTGDANGRPAKFEASVTMRVIPGNPATPADEADLKIEVQLIDVRRADDLEDYTGELLLDGVLRITDRNTQDFIGGTSHGTVGDLGFPFSIPCAPTADTTVGSTCSLSTTLDAGAPYIKEGARSVWQLEQVKVYDGGPDGEADTADNTLFAVPGVFIP